MSVGIPTKCNTKNTMPVSLVYEGKQNETSIRTRNFLSFDKIISINGEGKNRFYWGDNIDSLQFLLKSGYAGKIRLIYIDPPYATTSNFVSREQNHAYSDELAGGEYVEFLRQRLIYLYDLLADNGSIYLHLDSNMAFVMKLIMDEIFGIENCRAFITRKKCSTKNYTKNTFGNISDYIMFYTKSSNYVWNRPMEPWDNARMKEQYPCIDEKTGRRYKKVPIHAPGTRHGSTGTEWRGHLPPKGKHWQYPPQKLDEMDDAGEIYWSPSGNPRRIVYCEESKGIPIQDIWLDYRDSVNQSQKTTGYPTEKNMDMIQMIVEASSNPGDWVLDCFAGSGTTLSAAFETNRFWIGADNSLESLKAILKRFVCGLEIYGDYQNPNNITQLSFDFLDKCPFEIWGYRKDYKIIRQTFESFPIPKKNN